MELEAGIRIQFADETYKAIWIWLDTKMEARKACKTMVGILALAHRADCEKQLGDGHSPACSYSIENHVVRRRNHDARDR